MISPRTFQSSGQISQHYVPGAYSRFDSVKGATSLVSANRAVIMGSAGGGEPDTLLTFTNIAQAVATLKSGPLMEAVRQAFNPGGGFVPQQILAMRVNSALQSSIDLKNGSNAMIKIKSQDYALKQNQLNISIAAGTTIGKKVIVTLGSSVETYDNVYRASLVITHASATVSIVNTSTVHTLTLSGGPITIDLTAYATIGDLAAYINQQAGYTAVVSAGQAGASSLLLDQCTTQSCVGGYTALSNEQAIIDALNNGSALVTAVDESGANGRAVPDNLSTTYFTGGSDGTYVTQDWTNALTELEGEDVQFISTPDTTSAVWSAIAAHCIFMSSVTQRKERQFIVGGAWGTTVATAVSNSQALNTYCGMYVYGGYTQRDVNGDLQNYDASYTACLLLGLAAALAINEPLTFKSINVVSLEKSLAQSDMDTLIANAVCPVNYNSQRLPVVVRQVNTYQTDDLKLNEFSCVKENFFVSRDLRSYIEAAFVGRPGSILQPGVVKGAVQVKLSQYTDLGIFTKDDTGMSYWNIVIDIEGDAVYYDFDAYLTVPTNFMFATEHFHDLVQSQ